ncbi:MAG: T9SS type A sorting domain-containing protein [Mariniphaga sp.]|nr:T9SS type A sorting domain-containing protein [Mariniphaga sp.]
MKLKLLLFLLFVSCSVLSLKAQYDYVYNEDTIRHLVISEVNITDLHYSYAEISNVSPTEAVNLATFEFGNLTSWTLPWPIPGGAENLDHSVPEYLRLKLPNKILWPGESFVLATVSNVAENMQHIDPERWEGRTQTMDDMFELADLQLHIAKTEWGNYLDVRLPDGSPMDSVSPYGNSALESWGGRNVFFLRQHISEIDSVVVDQVNGDFSRDGYPPTGRRDVAGVEGATATHILIRKYSIKQGDLFGDDWALMQGTDIEDSEWLPILEPRNGFGTQGTAVKQFWTVGNHGNYTLNPASFVSDVIDVNFTDTVMTVPWGTRNDYHLMEEFEEADGIAWRYNFSSNREDSAFTSARTGDEMIIYAAGNTLEIWAFDIVEAEPTDDANIVVPKNRLEYNVNSSRFNEYRGAPHQVTIGAFSMDTIFDVNFATRADSLMKYLEKAPEASWEIVAVDGSDRPDLMNGDILKVTAKDGSVKMYYVKVDEFLPSHNADLASITWPDIPEFYRGIFGWTGDTIPNFAPAVYSYAVQVPSDVIGIPAIIAKTEDLNAKVTVQRATNLGGTVADRTITFTSAAEDDTTLLTYSVILSKEKAPTDIQPFNAEPFFAQRAQRAYWGASGWEICNPGNQPIDMSNYMIVRGYDEGTPAVGISNGTTPEDWGARYDKYIPGRVWENEANWQVQPALAVQDLAVNPIVMGGDVFVAISGGASYQSVINFSYDIDFRNNPWGDTLMGGNPVYGWHNNTYYLFKIVNDSVSGGLKGVGDPNDFELIDVFGSGDGTNWVIAGHNVDQVERHIRKPHVWHGNTEYAASFGTDDTDSEWTWENRSSFGALGYGWDTDVKMPFAGLGLHAFDEVTLYRSFVTSSAYKVSPGYSMTEEIKGVVTGTTVDEFLALINKENEGQTLTVTSGTTVLSGSDVITSGSVLEVVSADASNTSAYSLDVSDGGLSNNALLTSTEYTIAVDGATGTVSVPAGINLADAKANVVVPEGANMDIVDADDKYVSLKALTFDSTYTDVTVNDQTFFEVVAEDGKTKILYQILPASAASDAFVTSNVYMVDQDAANIMYVPRGTAVSALLANLIPATGATVEIVDKLGNVRTLDNIYQDDKVVVTAADGVTVKVYYLSMLLTMEGPGELEGEETDYLAFVLSDVYMVDQIELMIEGGLTGDQDRLAFLANLIPSMGASVTILTADGIESTSDDLNGGDMVQVTALDGETVVLYAIDFIESINELSNDIQLYPNPTTGTVNISGIESGNRIRVFNAMGASIQDFVVNTTIATFSLDNEPAGMYLIMVDNSDQVIGRFKVIRK